MTTRSSGSKCGVVGESLRRLLAGLQYGTQLLSGQRMFSLESSAWLTRKSRRSVRSHSLARACSLAVRQLHEYVNSAIEQALAVSLRGSRQARPYHILEGLEPRQLLSATVTASTIMQWAGAGSSSHLTAVTAHSLTENSGPSSLPGNIQTAFEIPWILVNVGASGDVTVMNSNASTSSFISSAVSWVQTKEAGISSDPDPLVLGQQYFIQPVVTAGGQLSFGAFSELQLPSSGGGPLVTGPQQHTVGNENSNNPVADGSFEDYYVGFNDWYAYQYQPPEGNWTFQGGAGIAALGSGFFPADGADGNQFAMLQQYYQNDPTWIEQSVYLDAGTYSVDFQAAQRVWAGVTNSQVLQVSVDGHVLGTITPNSSSFDSYDMPFTVDSSGEHTLRFSALAKTAGDNTAFIDAVSIESRDVEVPGNPVPGPSGLVVTVNGSSEIDLSWQGVTNWSGQTDGDYYYTVDRVKPDGTGTEFVVNANNGNDDGSGNFTFADAGIAAGTYTYYVEAWNPGASGNNGSDFISAYAVAGNGSVPFPGGFGAVAQGSNQIDLSWTGATDSDGHTDTNYYYQIERTGSDGSVSDFAIYPNNGYDDGYGGYLYADTGLAGGVTYSYALQGWTWDNSLNSDVATTSTTTDIVYVSPTVTWDRSLADGSFEDYALPQGDPWFVYKYQPNDEGNWTFQGGAGIAALGSGFFPADNADGSQFAMLQQYYQDDPTWIQQSVHLDPGSYAVDFLAAQRVWAGVTNAQVLQVSVNGVPIGTITPASSTFSPYSLPFPVSVSGDYAIRIAAIAGHVGDNTAFVDNVCIGSGSLVQLNAGDTYHGTLTLHASDPTSQVSVNWGDGSAPTNGAGVLSHQYLNGGTDWIDVTVTDSQGPHVFAHTREIIVNQVSPVLSANLNSAGTSASLQVLSNGSIAGPGLTYSWTVTNGNASAVTFLDNDSATANNTTACFGATGTYNLLLTIRNSAGQVSTATTSLNVVQVSTSIAAAPIDPFPAAGRTQRFSAVAYDQFAKPLATQPVFTWSTTGTGYTISSSGILTAPMTVGAYSVKASNGAVSSTALMFNRVIAAVSPAQIAVNSPTTATLSVQGADPMGAGDITYTWHVADDAPGLVSFDDNGDSTANQTIATFSAAGTYHLLVVLKDSSGNSTTSSVSVTVNPVLTSISATSTQPSPARFGTQQFSAVAFDQFGTPLVTQPTFVWQVTGSGYSISSSGLLKASLIIGSYNVKASSGSVNSALVYYSQAPAVPIVATKSVDVSNTFATLNVLGTDTLGGSDLTYSWTVSSGNAAAVGFDDNVSHTARSTTAYFSAAGNYSLLVTVRNPGGQSVTSTVNVTIAQILTSIAVTPLDPVPGPNGTQHFAAVAYDQFGNPLSTQPNFAWRVDNSAYTIRNGVVSTPATPGNYRVTAGAQGVYSTPESFSQVLTATSINATVDPSTQTTATLSVLGTDPAGESTLIYTWAINGSAPAPVNLSSNGINSSKNTTATFEAAGTYNFLVTITDRTGLATTAAVSVIVSQKLSSIIANSSSPTPVAYGTQQFTAKTYDQFGMPMSTQPNSFAWSVSGTGYSISPTGGLLTAGATVGNYHVTAGSGGVNSAAVYYSQTPTVSAAASRNVDASNTFATLNVLGTDALGGSDLTYAWTVTGGNRSSVSFSDNDSDTARSTTAYFSAAGNYSLLVTITNPAGQSITSSVSLSVSQLLTSVVAAPIDANIISGTQRFSATAFDQFGAPMATQPTSFGWSVVGNGNAYSISTAGVLQTSAVTGSYIVTANSGTVTSELLQFSQSMTVYSPAQASPGTSTTAYLYVGAYSTPSSPVSYTWSVTDNSPAGVSFSQNGSDAAGNPTATFSVPGTYTFLVTMTDADGDTTTSVTNSLVVGQVVSSVRIAPATPTPLAGGTQQFSAVAYDQFGNSLDNQPGFNWYSTLGTISSSGLLSGLPAGASYWVYATENVSGMNASLSFTPNITLTSPAYATLDSSRTFATLTAAGDDGWGGQDLTYAWTLASGNDANVYFADNGSGTAGNTKAYFTAAGTYTFVVTIADNGGNTVTSVTTSIIVDNILSSIDVMSADPVPLPGGTQQFSAVAYNQFGDPLAAQPVFSWSGFGGSGYSVSSTGLVRSEAGSEAASYSVTASATDIYGNDLDYTAPQDLFAPVIIGQPSVTPSGDGTSVTLVVHAADMSGDADLVYFWSTSDGSPAADFSHYDGNPLSHILATLDAAGNYDFTVTVVNDHGMSIASDVTLTVDQIPTSVRITSDNRVVSVGGLQSFTAEVDDQFGDALKTQPVCSWSIKDDFTGGMNQISPNGLLTAGDRPGKLTVSATVGSVSIDAQVDIKAIALTPHLHDESITTKEDQTSQSYNIFGDDTNGDAENDPYVPSFVAVTQQPSHGSVTIDSYGNTTYTPDFVYTGQDGFMVETTNSDGIGGTKWINVTVTHAPPYPKIIGNVAPSLVSNTDGSSVNIDLSQYFYFPDATGPITYCVDPYYGVPAATTVIIDGHTAHLTVVGDKSSHSAFYVDAIYPGADGWTAVAGINVGYLNPPSGDTPQPTSGTAYISGPTMALPCTQNDVVCWNAVWTTPGGGVIKVDDTQSYAAMSASFDTNDNSITITAPPDARIGLDASGASYTINWDGASSDSYLELDSDSNSFGSDIDFPGTVFINSYGDWVGAVSAGRVLGVVWGNASGSIDATESISVSVGRNAGLTLNAGGDVDLEVGWNFGGSITAGQSIALSAYGNINAPLTSTSGSVNVKARGSIAGDIHAATGINASAGYHLAEEGAFYESATIIGSVTSSAGQIGLYAPFDIIGSVTDGNGAINIGAGRNYTGNVHISSGSININSQRGNVTGSITADHGDIQNVSAAKNINGEIRATDGSVGWIEANEISAGIIAMNGISHVKAALDIDGNLTCSSGTINLIQAGRDFIGGIAGEADLQEMIVGRDLTGTLVHADSIDSVVVGRDLNAKLDATTDMGTVSVGRAVLKDIIAEDGSIISVIAGSSAWGNSYTAIGSISNVSIIAPNGSIGAIQVNAAAGYTGSMDGVSILSGGDIGFIDAKSGISGDVSAYGSIGEINPGSGNLAGSFTAVHGNLPSVTVKSGNFTAQFLATVGNVGDIMVGGDLTGNITAGISIGRVLVNGQLSGQLIAQTGSIGPILVGGCITSNVSAGAGQLSISSLGDMNGDVNATDDICVFVSGNVTGSFVTDFGDIKIHIGGNITAGQITATGDIDIFSTSGNITANITSSFGGIAEETLGTITSAAKASTYTILIAPMISDSKAEAENVVLVGTTINTTSLKGSAEEVAGADTFENVTFACFAAGTRILLADGNTQAIEALEPGQSVLAIPDHDQSIQPRGRRVSRVFHNQPSRILEVRVANEIIRVTTLHPFYVRGKGWVSASKLMEGDQLHTQHGEVVAVQAVVDTGKIEAVFNLEVEGDHTYFVKLPNCENAVWVHNSSGTVVDFSDLCEASRTLAKAEPSKNSSAKFAAGLALIKQAVAYRIDQFSREKAGEKIVDYAVDFVLLHDIVEHNWTDDNKSMKDVVDELEKNPGFYGMDRESGKDLIEAYHKLGEGVESVSQFKNVIDFMISSYEDVSGLHDIDNPAACLNSLADLTKKLNEAVNKIPGIRQFITLECEMLAGISKMMVVIEKAAGKTVLEHLSVGDLNFGGGDAVYTTTWAQKVLTDALNGNLKGLNAIELSEFRKLIKNWELHENDTDIPG